MIVGLDVGNSAPKLVMNGYRDTFPASIGEGGDINLEHKWTHADMDVTWRGRRLFVGTVAELQSDGASRIRTESKHHNDTLLLALCALHRAVPDAARIHLVTSIPIKQHTPKQRQLMRGLLLGRHLIQVNGCAKEIHIDSVDVTPETASAFFVVHQAKHTYIIDCGSRNTGYAHVWNNNFINPQSGTLPFGVENFHGSQMGYVKYVVSALSAIWPLDATIQLIGGAANILEPLFREWMPNARAVPDALWVNAKACHVLGVKKYGEAAKVPTV